MKAIKCLSVLALLAGSACAMAADPAGNVDVFYVPQTTVKFPAAVGNGHDDTDGGKGFGITGRYFVTPEAFLDGQYQANSYDGVEGNNVSFDLDWLRAGVGWATPMNLYLLGQFVSLGGESSTESGFGLQVGYHTDLGNPWELRGQVGYLDVGDVGDGFEVLVGGAFELSKPFRFFVDYRVTTLKEDDKLQFFDLLAGLRIRF